MLDLEGDERLSQLEGEVGEKRHHFIEIDVHDTDGDKQIVVDPHQPAKALSSPEVRILSLFVQWRDDLIASLQGPSFGRRQRRAALSGTESGALDTRVGTVDDGL